MSRIFILKIRCFIVCHSSLLKAEVIFSFVIIGSCVCLGPEGFGEALSGGEREYKSQRIIERMKIAGSNPNDYRPYLEIVQSGVPPSAGFGIGMERMTRWVCGVQRIEDVTLFPKCPGKITL